MSGTHGVARVMRWTAGGLGLIAVGYARVSSASPDERDPVGNSESMFRTETRVTTTDQMARTKFRWYWARFWSGIVLIRRVMLGLLKMDAERRALGRH